MSKSLNVRRCHVCGGVSESVEDILKCLSCSKSLLPFYYFDKKKVSEYADNKPRPEEAFDMSPQGYGPIRGLTATW
jgi:hypothetical protein